MTGPREQAEKLKQDGNAAYSAGKYAKASELYREVREVFRTEAGPY
jgi:hypothetical protein